jgi:uncharacterized protein
VHREGAAQIALLGAPNAGKSLLHARLTGSSAHDAPYPFTTQLPEPGMMPHADVHFQLVDLPAVSPAHAVPWLASALQTADAALLLVNLADADSLEQLAAVHDTLRARRVALSSRWTGAADASSAPNGDSDDDPLLVRLPALLLANQCDRVADPDAELAALCELAQLPYPAMAVSAATGHGLGELGPWLFRNLAIVRVYTKAPGKPPDHGRPFTLQRGQTVRALARLVHKDLERSLRFARVWGDSGFDGQHVGADHTLADGDVVELHT